jgi:hypothetical protein
VEAGVFSDNGARFWPSLAGTHYTDLNIAAGLPPPGVDYYTFSSSGGVIPWSDGTLGDDQFVIHHPSDGTDWIAQAFSTSGSNLSASPGNGVSAPGFGFEGGGTGGDIPTGFCGGSGRPAPLYLEIIIVAQVLPPTATIAASANPIAFGQSIDLFATTVSPSSSLFAQSIDSSPDGSDWTLGTTVAGASWTGGPASQNTLEWPFTPGSAGTWHFRAAGTDSVGVSNWAQTTVVVDKATPVGSFGGHTLSQGVSLSGLLTATFVNPFNAGVAQPTGVTTYAASGYGPVTEGTILPAGSYTITASYPGDANYNPNAAAATFAVEAQLPPAASISASPPSGTAPLAVSLAWSTANASSAVVAGAGVASTSLSGTQSVTLPSPGDYVFLITAGGPGGQVTRSAAVTVGAAEYQLTTFAVGSGTVTPGGVYPAGSVVSVSATPGINASFLDWTGGITGGANPLTVTMTGNLTVAANFVSMQAQTIAFSPPATASYPGPTVALTASASSGLPVSFSLASGPASLSGNVLTFTGPGSVAVTASQAGNGQWLPAIPVTGSIAVNPVAMIARLRFNATGNDARVVTPGAPPGSSFIWTDSSGLEASPWPSFVDPQRAAPVQSSTALPEVPTAPKN